MPAGAFVPTTTPTSRHLSVFIGGKDVTPFVIMDSFELEDTAGDGAQGTFRCSLNRKLSLLPELFPNAWTQVVDHDIPSDIFRGFLKTYRPVLDQGTTFRQTEIVATDHGELVDKFLPLTIKRPAEGDRARIGYFWGNHHPIRLNPDLTYVQSIDTNIAKVTYQGVTLRRVLDDIAAAAGTTVRWYIDQVGRLHYYATETNAAPKNVTSDAPGGGEISVEDLEINYDAGQYVNRVWVQGGNVTGSGWVQDGAAIAKIGTTITGPDPVDAPHSKTAASRDKIGLAYLARVTAGITRGSFSTTSNKATGWLSGQTLTVRSGDVGITADTRIVKVRTTVRKNDVRHYEIEFGALKHIKVYSLPAAKATGLAAPAAAWVGTTASDLSARLSTPPVDTVGAIADTTDTVDQTIVVSDEAGVVRAKIGLLGTGSFGMTFASPDGTSVFDGSFIYLTKATGTLQPGVAVGNANTTITASGLVANDGVRDRAILGALGGGDYGLKVVNPGGTVVIDGTSNMFKIAATGTLTKAFPAINNSVSSIVSLTGLGSAYTVVPAFLSTVTDDNSLVINGRQNGWFSQINLTTGVVQSQAEVMCYLSASPGTPQVLLRASSNTVNPGTTAACRYYVLIEAGI